MPGARCAALLALFALPGVARTGPAARGRHLVEGIAGCGNCHTRKGRKGTCRG